MIYEKNIDDNNLKSSELESSSPGYTSSNTSKSSSYNNDNKYNLHNLHGDVLKNYNIIEKIGRGGYSIVWLGFNIENSNFYAIKVQNSDDYQDGIEEIDILKKLKHKNVTKLIEYFIEERFDDNNKIQKYICSVYDLCCGNLDGLSRKGKYKDGYPSELVSKFYDQILSGLNYLHNDLKIFHGDIKPDNILLKGINNRDKKIINFYEKQNFTKMYSKIKKKYWIEKGFKIDNIKKMKSDTKLKIRKSLHKKIIDDMFEDKYFTSDEYNKDKFYVDNKYWDNPDIIITDFGYYCPDDQKFNESFGTIYYQAPEIILDGECNKNVDKWALGCTIYEFLTGDFLFDPTNDNNDDETLDHLRLIIEKVGYLNKYFLNKCKKKTKYFDKKYKLKKIKNVECGDFKSYLNKHIPTIENKEIWIKIINDLIKLSRF